MSLQYIIDGYNIIKHPLFARNARQSENSRKTLLIFIKVKKLTGSPKNKVTVVFDGYPDSRSEDFYSDINVIFSRKISADEKIKKLIDESGNRKNMVVVSGDNEIRYFAKSAGATVQGVDEFFAPAQEAQEKKRGRLRRELEESKLNYSQMDKINKELRNIWLK